MKGEFLMIKYAQTIEENDIEMRKGNFLRHVYFGLIEEIATSRDKLDFPTHQLQIGEDFCEEYEIPKECMQNVLSEVNPLDHEEHFKADDNIYNIVNHKTFRAIEFRVIRFNNFNYLVTPWFEIDGTTHCGCIKE